MSEAPIIANPVTAEEFEAALSARDEADYQCYMALQTLVEWYLDPQFFVPYLRRHHLMDKEDAEGYCADLQEVLNQRERCNDKVLGLLYQQRKAQTKPS